MPKAKYPSWEPDYVKAYLAKRMQDPCFAARRRAAQAAYYRSNSDTIKAKSRAYYKRSRKRAIERAKKWRAEHHDYALALRRARYREAYAHYIAKSREYARRRIESGKAKAYREKTRDIQRLASRERAASVTDGYAREILSKNSPISAKDWPQELVDAKKIQLLIKRTYETRHPATK